MDLLHIAAPNVSTVSFRPRQKLTWFQKPGLGVDDVDICWIMLMAQVRRGSDPWIDAVETKVASGCCWKVWWCAPKAPFLAPWKEDPSNMFDLCGVTVTVCYTQPDKPASCLILHGHSLAASGDLRHLPKPQIAHVVGFYIDAALVASRGKPAKHEQNPAIFNFPHVFPQLLQRLLMFTHVYSEISLAFVNDLALPRA